jgi:hypothetical protein
MAPLADIGGRFIGAATARARKFVIFSVIWGFLDNGFHHKTHGAAKHLPRRREDTKNDEALPGLDLPRL